MKTTGIIPLLLSTMLLSVLVSCKDDDDNVVTPVPKSTSKEISTVSFDNVSGETATISQSKILVDMSWRNSWEMAPTIIHSGKSISPEPSVKQDFSKPVKYTITAEDGSSTTYTVIVTSAKAGLADVETQYSYSVSWSDNQYHKFLQATESPDPSMAVAGARRLTIALGMGYGTGRDSRYFSNYLSLPNPYGNYLHTYNWVSVHPFILSSLTVNKSVSSSTIHGNAVSGEIKITNFNTEEKLVSGEFKNIKYLRGGAYPHYLTSGSFLNVPVEIK